MEKPANVTKITVALLSILFAGLVVAAPREQGHDAQEKPIRVEDYLPEGDARNLILQGCVQCHELRNTVSQRKTGSGWRRTVNEMIWRGAPLDADETETIVRYLTASFAPDKPLPDVFKKRSEKKQ
jgi:hypothetical protein